MLNISVYTKNKITMKIRKRTNCNKSSKKCYIRLWHSSVKTKAYSNLYIIFSHEIGLGPVKLYLVLIGCNSEFLVVNFLFGVRIIVRIMDGEPFVMLKVFWRTAPSCWYLSYNRLHIFFININIDMERNCFIYFDMLRIIYLCSYRVIDEPFYHDSHM